jgi:hypothetical protein
MEGRCCLLMEWEKDKYVFRSHTDLGLTLNLSILIYKIKKYLCTGFVVKVTSDVR